MARLLLTFILSLLITLTSALAGEKSFESLIVHEIGKSYPQAEVELIPPFRWIRGELSVPVKEVRIIEEDSTGNVHFLGTSAGGKSAEGWVRYAAWAWVRQPKQRILRGEVLQESSFIQKKVDLARGIVRDMRGILYPKEMPVEGLEALQTLVEGQALTRVAVQRVPDLRRGDSVQIHLVSQQLRLATMGTALEPARLNQRVRVVTIKNKKELIGELREGGIVEVQL